MKASLNRQFMLTIMLVELNNIIACFIDVSWSRNLFERKLKKGDVCPLKG